MSRWTIFTIGVLMIGLLVAGYWGYTQYDARRDLEIAVANRYQNSFYGLVDNVEKVEVELAKVMVANGMSAGARHLSNVWQEAMTAQANLSQLPLGLGILMRSSKFLTQVGDYAYTLLRKYTEGKTLTETDRSQLSQLREQTTFLSQQLHELQARARRGQLNWLEIERGAERSLREETKSIAREEFKKINEGIEKFPTLIYDGPFSDHIQQRKPKALTGPVLDEGEVRQKVLAFLPDALKQGATIEKAGEIKGTIPGYTFNLKPNGSDTPKLSVDISKKGGHVINMINFREVKDSRLSLTEAADKARAFLESRGFKNMVPTYATKADNTAVIPFAPKENDVIIYPDLIKVKVALDTGEIVGYEALGYIMAHHKRDIPEPKLSAHDARAAVSPDLTINSTNLALIPLETLEEVLCYEFKGTAENGDPYIVYVNALTGEEERVLKVIVNEEGTTTI